MNLPAWIAAGAIATLICLAILSAARQRAKATPREYGDSGYYELDGRGAYKVHVAGSSQYQANLLRICGGKRTRSGRHKRISADILLDGNFHDSNAVRVDIKALTVGYLPRELAPVFRDAVRGKGNHFRAKAMIVGGWADSGEGAGYFGVRLDI